MCFENYLSDFNYRTMFPGNNFSIELVHKLLFIWFILVISYWVCFPFGLHGLVLIYSLGNQTWHTYNNNKNLLEY